MAATKERLHELDDLDVDVRAQPRPEPDPVTRSEPVASPGAADRTSAVAGRRWALWLAAAWVVGFASLSFQPAPNGNVEPLLWGEILSALFYLAVFVTLMHLPDARPRSFKLSAFAGALGVVLGAGCLFTHHHLGLWPYYEIAAFGALGCASVLALRRT